MKSEPRPVAVPERERRFYLEQFAGRTIVLGSPALAPDDEAAVRRCAADLVADGVRVVRVAAGGRVAHWQPDDAGVVAVWRQLRRHGRAAVTLPDGHPTLEDAARLAARLRAFKLVLLDPARGRATPEERPESFAVLDADAAGGDGPVALAATALAAGVATVNVCHPADLAQELLTYAGAGTCYTLGDYTRVDRVGVDDYDQVAELVGRGVEEGYLKPRDPDAVARLLVNGYGARVGDHHLAGFAALLVEPYADAPGPRLGELCALTTISRFAGGGVGGRVVDAVLHDAVRRGLDGVFACTTVDTAAAFFRRLGFVEVPHGELPDAKWRDADPDRRARTRAFVHWLAML